MMDRRSSKGFVLVFSLVLSFCAGVILAGVLGYVSFAARQSSISAARSSCRLAAMSAIERSKKTSIWPSNGVTEIDPSSASASMIGLPRGGPPRRSAQVASE